MARTAAEKIALMHQAYGKFSGVRCRTCPHLVAHCNGDCNRVWYKCRMFGDSAGNATDWRISNEACGAFKISEEEAKSKHLYGEVFRLNKGKRDYLRVELPGQLRMEI